MKKKLFHRAKTKAKAIKTKGDEYVEAKRTENDPPKNVPRITSTAIPEHREEVLSSARKFIYPLQHSKHKIVMISTSIVVGALLIFFTYTTIALYRLGASSSFMYKVTQIVPFPIARVGRDFVAYENYLFELRRYMHYYETQQKLDFDSESGQQQLEEFKRRALDRVVTLAYVKKLAKEHNVTVSDQEINDQVQLLKDQNRLGNGEQVFEDVLQDYFGWSVADFKRYLGQEILVQKVVAAMDTQTTERANAAYADLQAGTPFPDVAKKYSDDAATKDNGGEIGTVTPTSRDVSPQAIATLMSLQPGQYSTVVNTGYSLEILKVLEKKDNQIKAAHIEFKFKGIDSYTNDMKEKQPSRVYIPTPAAPPTQ